MAPDTLALTYFAVDREEVEQKTRPNVPSRSLMHEEAQSVTAIIGYQAGPENPNETLYRYLLGSPPAGQAATNSRIVKHEMQFTDMRPMAAKFSIDKQGFELHKIGTPSRVNWECPADVSVKYYPEVEDYLKSCMKGTRVHVFEHAVRSGKVEDSKVLAKSAVVGEPLPHCHVDFSATGGVAQLQHVLPKEAETLKKTPYAIIQVWRPIVGPVKSSPLALVDVSTVDSKDLMNNNLLFPDRTQGTYHVRHNPNHRWYYAKDMMPDEAYVFVQYDSRMDRARFTPHAAFQDPTLGPHVSPRQSIEIRAFVFWEDLPEQPYSSVL